MVKTRYDTSIWLDRIAAGSRPKFPVFRGERACDVVVVGAGLTGALTAYWLAKAGADVVVVDAGRVADGATAHGSGILFGTPEASFRDLRERHGLRAARHVFEESSRATLELCSLLRRLDVRADCACGEGLQLATTAEQARTLELECDAERAAGLDAPWLSARRASAASRTDAEGAIRRHADGTVDPYRATLGIVAAATKAGATFHERSLVRRTRYSKNGAEVHLATGALKARHVVVATGEPGRLFPALRRHFVAHEAFVVVTEPLPKALASRLGPFTGRDSDVPPHRWRLLKDRRILVQGADDASRAARGRESLVVQRSGQLMYELSRLYPDISGVRPAYAWSCPGASAADGLFVAGPHRAVPHHVFALGLARAGLGGAYLASKIAMRHVTDECRAGDEHVGFGR
ncbi:MAG: FAD-binding oxidoreductase [Vicinamibacterales bacterium]